MKLAAFSSMPWLVKNIFPAEMLSLPKVAFLLSFSHVSFLFLVKMGHCMSRSLAICGAPATWAVGRLKTRDFSRMLEFS